MEEQIDALKIKCSDQNQAVSQLSGGNKQKVVFGKWIGCGSEILILDCPTRGVDIGVKQAMYQLMTRLKEEGKLIGRAGISMREGFDIPEIGYMIAGPYRGKGYGAQGLELLCAAAKENGITVLYDDIAVDNPAVRLFLAHGFYEDHRTEEKIVLKKDL